MRINDDLLYRKSMNLIDDLLKTIITENDSIISGGYDKVPHISMLDNGMPSWYISTVFNSSPIQPSKQFDVHNPKINLDEIDSYLEYKKYVLENEHIYEFFIKEKSDNNREFYTFMMRFWILELLDSYFYRYGKDFDESKFLELYTLKENLIYNEEYNVNIIIPLLLLKSDITSFVIDDGVEFVKMSDELQLARSLKNDSAPAITEGLYAAATHCIIFKRLFC